MPVAGGELCQQETGHGQPGQRMAMPMPMLPRHKLMSQGLWAGQQLECAGPGHSLKVFFIHMGLESPSRLPRLISLDLMSLSYSSLDYKVGVTSA